MSVYSRIYAATSRHLVTAVKSGRRIPPVAFWIPPALVASTWFIWGALTDDIKMSFGLYYDPDIIIKRVEAEREERLVAKAELKAASKTTSKETDNDDDDDEEEDEEEEEEEEVTAETIEAAVNKAVEAASGSGDDANEDENEDNENDSDADDDDEEEEEEEEEKPKKEKVNFKKLSLQEKWEYFAERAVVPGEDDEEVSTRIQNRIWIC